ncbi:CAF17-like 4Fe-4S cluster assembly/insertion protein YgfZ [Pelagibius marinus]|uniref:CAF17-like 4Fe-4S cluster assembly/insertion protein YgfZ n=1 Tax=Pelagibius marinus TaxID=2762760 RepID=UPI00187307C9|nr:folate-binding protein YgfZ [Pelagibius marinus]
MAESPDNEARAVILAHRGVLRIGGADRRDFLQGIVSNDVTRVTPESAVWSAFLTPQGKFLHEFFLVEEGESFLADCEAERSADLARRLKLYKLRAQVSVEAADDLAVAALFGAGALAKLELPAEPGRARPFAGGRAFVDPRLPSLGARALLPKDGAEAALGEAGFSMGTLADYDALRIAAGVPDGSRDLEVEKATLLESGFDELHGIDWDKGCYMGQELTARMRYRGLTKKRLIPVVIAGPAPEPGTPLTRAGKESGTLRSAVAHNGGSIGLALLRLDALEDGEPLLAGDAEVTPKKPAWASF